MAPRLVGHSTHFLVLDWPWVARAIPWALICAWSGVYALSRIARFVTDTQASLPDGHVYALAARAWLAGGDPWSVTTGQGVRFAAPPPTLVTSLPLVPFGEYAGYAGALLALIAAVYSIRRLALPWYWLFWPPILDSVAVGNPDTIVLALLVSNMPWLSVFPKLYGIVPLVWALRWRQAAIATFALLVTVPLLPWHMFVSHRDDLARVFAEDTAALSAWGWWPLLGMVILAMVSIGRRASWLVVPAAWPYTQLHYGAMALPLASRSWILALGLSIPIAPAPAIAVIAYAASTATRFDLRRRERVGDRAVRDCPSRPKDFGRPAP